MKIDCNVARDLMPLVIDQAASAESEDLVKAHVTECPLCADYMNGMQAELTRRQNANDKDRKDFDQAAKRLRSQRRHRMAKNVLVGVLVGVLLVLGGLWGWQRLTQDYVVPVYDGEYGVSLAQLESGKVSVNIDYRGSRLCSGIEINGYADSAKGEAVLYICDMRSILKQYMASPNENYSCTCISSSEMTRLWQIRQGTPEKYKIIWQQGDVIPAASKELEEYAKITETLLSMLSAQNMNGEIYAMTKAQENEWEQLQQQLVELKKSVPEWN